MRRFLLQLALAAGLALAVLLVLVPPSSAEAQIHIVQPGENLFRIALRYGVTVQALQSANGRTTTSSTWGKRWLSLAPPPAHLRCRRPSGAATNITHVVQRGETLLPDRAQIWPALDPYSNLRMDCRARPFTPGSRLIIPLANAPATPRPPYPEPTATAYP